MLEAVLAMLEPDPVMVVWWGTAVELVSAISRRERDGALTPAAATSAIESVRALQRAWHQAVTTDSLHGRAQRPLRVHPLRAADSLQLAATLSIAGDDPTSVSFVSLDQRQADAARREGVDVWAG